MDKFKIIDRLREPGVVAVIRADSSHQLRAICDALVAGGVTALEITMTTPNALEVIREVSQALGEKVLLGVGTVLDPITARLAILAGAQFVVTPVTKREIIEICRGYARPIISGAYTPTEALTAHEMGADFIKIFPADGLGANYIKALRAPLPQLEIIPTGGVDLGTAGAFIRAGCAAVAAGSSLVSREIQQKQAWGLLSDIAAQFVQAVADARAGK